MLVNDESCLKLVNLVLMNATMYKPEIDKTLKHKTMFMNKDHILWAVPDEDQR